MEGGPHEAGTDCFKAVGGGALSLTDGDRYFEVVAVLPQAF